MTPRRNPGLASGVPQEQDAPAQTASGLLGTPPRKGKGAERPQRAGLAGIYAMPTSMGAIWTAYCVCGSRSTGACESAARETHESHVAAGHPSEEANHV